jgi:2-iminobutanoate/2-iminopropanoate deaminase
MSSHKRKVVVAEGAPKAIGPYSVAIRTENFIFASGSLGVDPETGEFAAGGVEGQTRQALKNLAEVLKAGGSSLEQVVKTTVFLQDMAEFTSSRTNHPPVQLSRLRRCRKGQPLRSKQSR